MNLYKEMAGKSTRKGPERALIFELSPVVSSRNQVAKRYYRSLSLPEQEHDLLFLAKMEI